jgi:putative membrane protein
MKKGIITIVIGFSAFTVKAQIPQPDPDTTARHFLIVASIANLQETSAAQLAIKKGKSSDIRSFAQMMIKDHGEAEQKLLQLAKGRRYYIPAAADAGIKPDLNLENAGADFDRLYVHAMVAGHANTVEMFQTYATTGKDPAVKAFAAQMLPTLKAHLAAIKALDKKYKDLTAK